MIGYYMMVYALAAALGSAQQGQGMQNQYDYGWMPMQSQGQSSGWAQQYRGDSSVSGAVQQQPAQASASQNVVPLYLHKDGRGNRVLLLHKSATSYDRTVYADYWLESRLMCIAASASGLNPQPLYAYRKDLGGGVFDHFYTTNSGEIGTTSPGQVGKYGYICMGTLGYVGTKESAAGRADMIPLYRWLDGGKHYYDTNPANGRGTSEGITGYGFSC